MDRSTGKSLMYEWGSDPEFTGPQNFFRQSLILRELTGLSRGSRVLDAGCGTGTLAFRMGEAGFSVHGVDASHRATEYIRHKSRLLPHLKVNASTGDITRLPHAHKHFDAVVCGEVLKHLSDDYSAMKEFHRVLKPKGTLVITVPAHRNKWNELDNISAHVRRYDESDMRQLAEKNGFRIERLLIWGFPLSHLWQQYLFLPMLRKSLERKSTITHSKSFVSSLIRRPVLHSHLSHIFNIDLVMARTRLGGFMHVKMGKAGT